MNNFMENIMSDAQSLNIYQRVHAVMKDVKTIRKEDKKVNGQYTYAGHDEVTRVLHDAFVTHRIVMVPSVAELVQDGNRTSVKMDIEFVNIDNPTDRFKIFSYGYGIDAQDKGVGKAVSYAVKYGLLKEFCLETADDVEKDNIDHKPSKSQTVKKDMIQKKEEPKKQLNIWAQQIKELMIKHYPGQTTEDQKCKGDLLEKFFQTRYWANVESTPPHILEKKFVEMQVYLSSDNRIYRTMENKSN